VRRRSDYLRVQANAQRVTTAHYYFLLAPSPSSGSARLGMIVTRKVGNAVVRNRIKRIVRECFRRTRGLFPDGIDVVVVARAGAEALSQGQADAEWEGVRPYLQKRARQALARAVEKNHVPPRQAERPPRGS